MATEVQNILQTIHLSILNIDSCCARNWNFQNVISPFCRIYLVKNGDGRLVHNNKSMDLLPGKLYLIPGFTRCDYLSSSYFEHYYIHFIPELSGEATFFDLFDFNCEVTATSEDLSSVKRLLELNPGKELQNTDPCKYSKANLLPMTEVPGSPIQIATYLETQGLLLRLFSRFIKGNGKNQHHPVFCQQTKIGKALPYIQQNLNRSVSISELAEICNLSKDYFSRLFLKTMGARPLDFINRKRIESAQLELITTNDTIEKIALESGIDNFSYFNRLFKKYSCMTPGEYRRLHKLI